MSIVLDKSPQNSYEKEDGKDSKVYLSLSLSLRNFSRHALELEAVLESDLPLQQE